MIFDRSLWCQKREDSEQIQGRIWVLGKWKNSLCSQTRSSPSKTDSWLEKSTIHEIQAQTSSKLEKQQQGQSWLPWDHCHPVSTSTRPLNFLQRKGNFGQLGSSTNKGYQWHWSSFTQQINLGQKYRIYRQTRIYWNSKLIATSLTL